MADESLFDFLHMEIVSHVYKHSSKGEMDNKVSETIRAQIYRPWRVYGRTVPRHRLKVCCRLYKYNPSERLFLGSSCLCVCPRGDGLPGGSRTH